MRTSQEFAAAKEAFRRRFIAAGLSPAALKVGIAMLECTNREIYVADGPLLSWPSVPTLCGATGLSERSVQRGRGELVKAGAMAPVGTGREGKYAFCPSWITANHLYKGAKIVGRLDIDSGDKTRGSGVPAPSPKPPEENIHARERARDRAPDHRPPASAGDRKPARSPALAGTDPHWSLAQGLGDTIYRRWLFDAEIVVIDDTALIEVASEFLRRWIAQRLEPDVCRLLGVRCLEVSVIPKNFSLQPVARQGSEDHASA